MKKVILTILIVASLFLGSVIHVAADTQPSVTIIGDSLTDGAKTKLAAALPNAYIDSRVGRPWAEGLQILQSLNSAGKVAPIVVFALGTNNDTLQPSDIASVLAAAPNSHIYFLTIYDASPSNKGWADSVNQSLSAAQAANPSQITLLDWAGIASTHATDWFADGIHPTKNPAGYSQYANLITQAVGGQAPSGSGPPSSPSGGNGTYLSESNTVVTTVGNAVASSSAATNNSLVKTAEDLRQAFNNCTGGSGSTVGKTGLGDCLASEISKEGYDADIVSKFKTRYPGTIAYEASYKASCTQCLGFVDLALLMFSGDPSALQLGNAADVLTTYPKTFTISGSKGKFTFNRVTGIPQAGDIAVSAAANHILFINQMLGNAAFTGVESNGGDSCAVTDNRQRLVETFDGYYRLQSP